MEAWVPPFTRSASVTSSRNTLFQLKETKVKDMFFATTTAVEEEPSTEEVTKAANSDDSISESATRILGSQELLMLPRQYGPSEDTTFPQMNHVSVAILSETPAVNLLEQAIDAVIDAHPLLQSVVVGDGEPGKRIDLFQMVREGEPNPCTFASQKSRFTSKDILSVVQVQEKSPDALEQSWKNSFARDLDDGSWCKATEGGPLYKMELHSSSSSSSSSASPCALLMTFNHAISDQSSANRLLDAILASLASLEAGSTMTHIPQEMPVALEDSVLGIDQRWSDVQVDGISPATLGYVAGKAAEGFKSPVILPDEQEEASANNALGALSIISGQAAGGEDTQSFKRRSALAFRSLSVSTTSKLLEVCRANGVTVSNALTAAATLTATDFIGKSKERNYKVLQSLDMRRFGAQLDKADTMACMAGSMDLMHGPLKDGSGRTVKETGNLELFWELAREGKTQTAEFCANGGPEQAVRVFDFAMSIADLNNLVYLTSQSKDTKGRAYSAGVTNVGVYEREMAFERTTSSNTAGERPPLRIQHGRYQVEDVFFATPHTSSGCLYQTSCMTVDGALKMTFHPVSPIISDETSADFADSFVELLETVAGARSGPTSIRGKDSPVESSSSGDSLLPEGILTKATAAIGLGAVLVHAPAYASFFQSVAEMKANIADPADFWAALNFWIFFAVAHPILQPVLWISDVLHASPGPLVGGLVPATFLVGNILAIGLVSKFKDVRNSVNIAALAAFFAYIGSGLGGTAGLGDFNLSLDDSYQGRVFKGCPAYDEVRQPSMDNFDITKYQGLWYEHKFHDWTQFKEVYDTTLGIKLTEGGRGWTDDFAVKGPAPDSAKLSWDKSPVANGAHYFLFGRVDPKDPPGILRESGFGVEFPNYIVDVQKDPDNGEYKEAIQFQCLERGGVRVFEGINFMSRNPTMSDSEMDAMHQRAKAAGMYPYGADPDQMHTVARRPVGAPEIDNNWQAMWRAIGVDKLLELLTEAIEDGGR